MEYRDADIYVDFLMHEELPKKEIIKFLKYNLKEVEQSIENLIERGFITVSDSSDQNEIYKLVPFWGVKAENRPPEISQQTIDELVKYVLPEIRRTEELGVIRFDGWDGIEKVYWEILEEAIEKNEKIYALESNNDKSIIGQGFLDTYIKKRVESNVVAHVICPNRESDQKYKAEHESECTKIKTIDAIEIDANINICGDLVMSFSIQNRQGVLRRNKAEANTLRSVFMQLWNPM